MNLLQKYASILEYEDFSRVLIFLVLHSEQHPPTTKHATTAEEKVLS